MYVYVCDSGLLINRFLQKATSCRLGDKIPKSLFLKGLIPSHISAHRWLIWVKIDNFDEQMIFESYPSSPLNHQQNRIQHVYIYMYCIYTIYE